MSNDKQEPEVITLDYWQLNKACEIAFTVEDGYGDPKANPHNYRKFRDGFFAGFHANLGSIIKKDAALQECVKIMLAVKNNNHTASDSEAFDAVITKAQEALK